MNDAPAGTGRCTIWRVDEIAVVTSDVGPSGDDIVWVFATSSWSKTLAISAACPGFPALLEVLQQLPDFDNVTLLEALSFVTAERFVVWRRPRA